jgi:hypothetical protein
LLLLSVLTMGLAHAAPCTWAWTPPGPGGPAFDAYRLYKGVVSKTYTSYVIIPVSSLPDATKPTYTTQCAAGEYYALTATAPGNLESDKSNEVFVTQVLSPSNLKVILQLTLP